MTFTDFAPTENAAGHGLCCIAWLDSWERSYYTDLNPWLVLYGWRNREGWRMWKSYKSEQAQQDALENLERQYAAQDYFPNRFMAAKLSNVAICREEGHTNEK